MCGERLPDRTNRTTSNKPSENATPAIVPPTTRVFDDASARQSHGEKWVEAPASSANPAAISFIPAGSQTRGPSDAGPSDRPTDRGTSGSSRSLVDSLAERRPAAGEERRGRRDVSEPSTMTSSAGSSFLGLGSADYEPPQREISWRFWALMLVLLGIVALFGLQWRANRLRAEQ